jgi:S1-C subfamily serine protease
MGILKDIIKGIAYGTILGLALVLAFADTPLSEQQIYNDTRAETFRILSPRSLRSGGTGFAVKAPSGNVYTLTNAHVCQLAENGVMVAEREGALYATSVINVSATTDLCLLNQVKPSEGLELGDSASLHERLYIVGHPYLNPITISAGYTHATGSPLINYCMSMFGNFLPSVMGEFDYVPNSNCIKAVRSVFATAAAAAPGNSGSPALDAFGKVVGVLFAGTGTGESLIVPLEDIRDFLAAY